MPKEVQIYTSLDGVNFTKGSDWKSREPINTEEVKIETINISKLGKSRYVKLVAKKLGELPKWHLGYPYDGRSWLFIDEIQIR